MKRYAAIAALAAFAVTSVACYNTKVQTGAAPVGPTYQDRQWFTIGGLVGLSGPAGRECDADGLSRSESRMAGMDILINIGLGIVGGAAGVAICDEDASAETYGSCVSGVSTLVPFLLSSRTVSYRCARGPRADELELLPGERRADLELGDED